MFVKAVATDRDAALGGALPCKYCIKYRQPYYSGQATVSFLDRPESVHRVHTGLQSLLSKTRMEGEFDNSQRSLGEISKSLASLRRQLSLLGTKVALPMS